MLSPEGPLKPSATVCHLLSTTETCYPYPRLQRVFPKKPRNLDLSTESFYTSGVLSASFPLWFIQVLDQLIWSKEIPRFREVL